MIWPKELLFILKHRPRIDPFFSKNQNFGPKHEIPKNKWEKLNRFHYCQFLFFKSALKMKSDKNLIFADIVYFGFFASLAVMRGVNFNLNQAGGNLDEASCIPTGTDKQRNGKE